MWRKGYNLRKKIREFIESQGYIAKFSDYVTIEHYGGRGWNNDGTYQEEVYKISKDKDYYFIRDKVTGRPRYTLEDKNFQMRIVAFSQRDFINKLEKFLTQGKAMFN